MCSDVHLECAHRLVFLATILATVIVILVLDDLERLWFEGRRSVEVVVIVDVLVLVVAHGGRHAHIEGHVVMMMVIRVIVVPVLFVLLVAVGQF